MHDVDAERQRRSLPVACTLGQEDGRSRVHRWRRLHERAEPVAHLDGAHLEVRYQSGVGVEEELTELAAAEQTCCGFAEWRVVSVGGSPVLHVTAAPDAIASIAVLFGAAPSSLESG